MHNEDCNDGSSYHQQLYSIYNLVIVTLIRGYSMIIHAHKISGSKIRAIGIFYLIIFLITMKKLFQHLILINSFMYLF